MNEVVEFTARNLPYSYFMRTKGSEKLTFPSTSVTIITRLRYIGFDNSLGRTLENLICAIAPHDKITMRSRFFSMLWRVWTTRHDNKNGTRFGHPMKGFGEIFGAKRSRDKNNT
jgi:hypothetical protein